VRYWLHNEFLVLDKGKMSKSAGGFLTLQALVDAGYDPLDYRYFLLGGHYRSQLQFSLESLRGARYARLSLLEKLCAVEKRAGEGALEQARAGRVSVPACTYLDAFDAALDDDLNTPRALAELWGLLRDTTIPPDLALSVAVTMDEALGLGLAAELEKRGATKPPSGEDAVLAAEVLALIAERAAAKKAKDFVKADAIRAGLRKRGILLEDTPSGTVWRKQ
jgi:cysteinyl-tRNA synthetase